MKASRLDRLMFYRTGHRVPALGRLCTFINYLLFRAYIPSTAVLGANVKLAYGACGLVVHKRAVVGDNCLLSPGVVIGGRGDSEDVPVIEDDVALYPGCKILGPIRIGRGSIVGANAVVVDDLPPGSVVVAPAARVLR